MTAWREVRRFFVHAYRTGITGLAGMVAYNLLLSIFPLALLALFIASRVIQSGNVEHSVIVDLERVFPSTAEATLRDLLDRLRDSSTGVGIFALASSIWIGASFWGALDTAFCRIYERECRSWVRQKRFAMVMLVFVLIFMFATVAVPALQGILAAGAHGLPFGLANVHAIVFALGLAVGVALLFGVLCVVYLAVPRGRVPWRGIWPGALGATLAITIVDYGFPLYLSNISTLGRYGTTFVFILIVLVWFFALAIILLAGAVVNELRLSSEAGT